MDEKLTVSNKAGRVSGVGAGNSSGSARKTTTSVAKKPAAAFSQNPNAADAIMAVAKAAEQLPPEDQINFSLMSEGGEAAGNDSAEPPNYRLKVVVRCRGEDNVAEK